jgi:hypothetical protein
MSAMMETEYADETEDDSFEAVITNRASFSQAIEIVSHTLSTAVISLEEADDNKVTMRIDAIDSSHCCAVKMRMTCTGNVATSGAFFAVKLKTLKEMLKILPVSDTVTLGRENGCDTISIKSRSSENITHTMPTLNDEYEPVPIENIKSMYTVNFETSKLKSYMRLAASLKCTKISIKVHELESSNAMGRIVLVFGLRGDEGETKFEYDFTKEFRDDGNYDPIFGDGDTVQRTLDEDSIRHTATYDCKYIEQFVRSMERQAVILSFDSNKPLVIEYGLGQEDASVRFLLAPHVEDA